MKKLKMTVWMERDEEMKLEIFHLKRRNEKHDHMQVVVNISYS